MDLHLARVQQRWRYADDELAPGESLKVEALAHDFDLLPDTFEGPPDKVADVMLASSAQSRRAPGASIEAVADEDGVLRLR
jgi:type IV secretion system protein VirD4